MFNQFFFIILAKTINVKELTSKVFVINHLIIL